MMQHMGIEDMIIPLRTYAWAATGSVSLADELLVNCFKRLSDLDADLLPGTQTEWFKYIDQVVLDWTASEQESCFSENEMAIQTIKKIITHRPAILGKLLDSQVRAT